MVSSGLLFMQKNFFDYPEAIEYRRQPDGSFATFREEPSWLRSDRYLNIDIVNPHERG